MFASDSTRVPTRLQGLGTSRGDSADHERILCQQDRVDVRASRRLRAEVPRDVVKPSQDGHTGRAPSIPVGSTQNHEVAVERRQANGGADALRFGAFNRTMRGGRTRVER